MEDGIILEDLLDMDKYDYEMICDIVQEYDDIAAEAEVDIDSVDDSFFMLWVLFGRMAGQLKESLEEIHDLKSEGRNVLQFKRDL